jgi:4-diphosphocytidyl-2-C-methyl-D-erythritol kinase
MISETAYAKINLALHVRRRRADGFHDIESLFAFAESGDMLRATSRADGLLNLSIEGPFADGLDPGPNNLVIKAAHALQSFSRTAQGADMALTKNLPVASGIGGGSADAAAALRMLDRLWGLNTPLEQLLAIADGLGSDVPACVVSRTLLGTGRGEALDIRDLPGVAGAAILLVNPSVGLSTGPVFQGWDRQDRGPLDASTLDVLISAGRNDLQLPAIALVPEIADILSLLAESPAILLARMSGSGATVFGLFDDDGARDMAAAAIKVARPGWWTMATRLRHL